MTRPWFISVRIRQGLAGVVFGESKPAMVRPSGSALGSYHRIFTDAGTIRLGWSLRQGATTSTCEARGVTSVQVEARPASGPAITETFPCTQYAAITSPLLAGTYQLVVTAGTATATIEQVRAGIGGKATVTEPIVFMFQATK